MQPNTALIPRQADSDQHLIGMFLFQKHQRSRNTFRAYRKSIQDFLLYVRKPIRQITIGEILGYQHELIQRGLAPATQARMISAVRSLFGWAKKLGYVEFDPAAVSEIPRAVPVRATRFLTKKELAAIINAAKERSQRDYLVVLFLILTGARVAEALSVRWCDIIVSPDGGLGLRIIGKGLRTRAVRLPDRLWVLICGRRRRLGLSVELSQEDERPILSNQAGRPLAATSVNNIIRRAAFNAGVDKPISAHWLRHAHATFSLLGGAPIDLVASSLGNSVAVCQRYLHSAQALEQSSVNYLDLDV